MGLCPSQPPAPTCVNPSGEHPIEALQGLRGHKTRLRNVSKNGRSAVYWLNMRHTINQSHKNHTNINKSRTHMKGQNTHRWLFTLKKPVLGPPNVANMQIQNAYNINTYKMHTISTYKKHIHEIIF